VIFSFHLLRSKEITMQRTCTILISCLVLVGLGLGACNKNNSAPSPPVVTSGGPPAQPAPTKDKRIVFIFKSAGQYSEACKKGQEQANEELKPQGVTVEYRAPDKADVGKQIAMVEQLIAEKADAVVISPNDAKAIEPIVKKAMDAGVKVFTWDSDAPTSARIFYVAAADDVQIGMDIAEALAKDLGDRGKVQIMSGGRAADNLNLHVDGMKKGFAKYPGIKLIEPIIYNDEDTAKANSLAKQAFQKDPDLAGFACANSQSPPAAGEAVTAMGKIGKVKVWGLSLPSLTKPYLKSGAISGVMLWDPAKLTYFTAKLVNDYLNGKPPENGADVPNIGKISYKNGKVIMPGITFTKDNVEQFNF
jgi:rhamnose transport system substrate-binding protein